jgi:hypothetical protein
MFSLPEPQFMPCVDCGASLARSETESHQCEPERKLSYTLIQLREELLAFDEQLAAYLESPWGRFEAWYASRRRLDGR